MTALLDTCMGKNMLHSSWSAFFERWITQVWFILNIHPHRWKVITPELFALTQNSKHWLSVKQEKLRSLPVTALLRGHGSEQCTHLV